MRQGTFKSGLKGLAIAGVLAAGLFACGTSTQLVNVWRDPEYPSRPLHDVLVMQMSRDPAHRRLWEDEFTYELKHHGVHATPSYRIWAMRSPTPTRSSPRYYETERVARTRTDVWSTEGRGQLIWTGTSETYDPTSSSAVNQEVAKKIVPEL